MAHAHLPTRHPQPTISAAGASLLNASVAPTAMPFAAAAIVAPVYVYAVRALAKLPPPSAAEAEVAIA